MKLILLVLCVFVLIALTSAKSKHSKHKRRKSKPKRSRTQPFIGDGQYFTEIHDYEFVVGLVKLFEQYHEYFCAGTIITKQWAITAAPCMSSERRFIAETLGKIVVRGGTPYIYGSAGKDHRIDTAYIDRNVSLIKVKDPFDDPHEMAVKEISSKTYQYHEGILASAFGWGEVTNKGSLSSYLKVAILELVKDKDCKEYYPDFDGDTSTLGCAHSFAGYFCNADIGGPVYKSGVLIGILYLPRKQCEDPDNPGMFIKIASYDEWIRNTVNDKDIVFYPPITMLKYHA